MWPRTVDFPALPVVESKDNLTVYKSFYSRAPLIKAGSEGTVRVLTMMCLGVIKECTAGDQRRPAKNIVTQRIAQEPKRHSSEKIFAHKKPVATHESDEGLMQRTDSSSSLKNTPHTATQFYREQLHHPPGVSTPPPCGYQYPAAQAIYMQSDPRFGPYPPQVSHYSTNTLPQCMVQGMQGLSLGDPAGQQQYVAMPTQYVQTPAGYYPVYMGYPPQVPMYASSPALGMGQMMGSPAMMSYYQPAPQFAPQPQPKHQIFREPAKKHSSLKPSQFRPQQSFEAYDHGEHKAANEDYILSVIKEYLEHGNDLTTLKGKLAGLAATQTGSRFLQKQLTTANPAFVAFVLKEVDKTLPDLMTDDYGNYFCQRLVSSCSPAQRIAFLQQIKGRIVMISKDKKGTHTIQSMLDVMTMDEEEAIVASDIKGHVFELANVPLVPH